MAYLDMSGCWQLNCLPSRIDMESLETLVLSNCTSLETFPEVSPRMVKLSNIYLDGCTNLKSIPYSICELKYLKSLNLQNCEKLWLLDLELPKEFESMEELHLGFTSDFNLNKIHLDEMVAHASINFHALTNLGSLRKLDLSRRQIDEENFPKNLDGLSSLEELHLSGNNKLIHLPANISTLSRLKHLELNDCCQLQTLHSLPSGIQALRASNCTSLKEIDDLSKEYFSLYKIWLVGCSELIWIQKNKKLNFNVYKRLLKMRQTFFIQKCAAVDHHFSVAVPVSYVPSPFNHACKTTLKFPPKSCHNNILGFVVHGLFHGTWVTEYATASIFFTFQNKDNLNIPETETERVYSTSSAADKNYNMWICYIPFSSFQEMMHEDWSHYIQGNLVISLSIKPATVVRTWAHILYKNDVLAIQQMQTSTSDYRKSTKVYGYGNTFVYEEKFRSS